MKPFAFYMIFWIAGVLVGITGGAIVVNKTPTKQSITDERVWIIINNKIKSKEIYFAGSVETLIEEAIKNNLRRGFEVGLQFCDNYATEAYRIEIVDTLPHGKVLIDTIYFVPE